MRKIKMERLVLNIGAVEDKLNKGVILLEKLTGRKSVKVQATKRIPTWAVRPGLEVGVKVTLRGGEALNMLKRLLPAVDNTLKEKQIQDNFLSFGVHEYIEVPDMEYLREVGVMGFEVTVVFTRAGKSIEKKKVKRGKARRSTVKKAEIEDFMINAFGTEIVHKKKRGDDDDSK